MEGGIMKINVLGTDYNINRCSYKDLDIFEKKGIDGYCDSITKEIVICNMSTHPDFEDETEDYCRLIEKQILRHEIVHAFFNESGLQDSSGIITNQGWSKNEEMVDWIALQFPKMLKAFQETGCL